MLISVTVSDIDCTCQCHNLRYDLMVHRLAVEYLGEVLLLAEVGQERVDVHVDHDPFGVFLQDGVQPDLVPALPHGVDHSLFLGVWFVSGCIQTICNNIVSFLG